MLNELVVYIRLISLYVIRSAQNAQKAGRCEIMSEILQEDKINKKGKWNWLKKGILVSMIAAIVFTSLYDVFKTKAEEYGKMALETEENVNWLYQNTYVLYRDLYNVKNQCNANYLDIYLHLDGLGQWFLSEESQEKAMYNGSEEDTGETIDYHASSLPELTDSYEKLNNQLKSLMEVFNEVDNGFSVMNNAYGYVIRDHQTDCYVTNMSEDDMSRLSTDSYFLLSFVFDSAGNVSVGEQVEGEDTVTLRRLASQAPKEVMRLSAAFEEYASGPLDCTVTYAVSRKEWRQNSDAFHYDFYPYAYSRGYGLAFTYQQVTYYGYREYWLYEQSGAAVWLMMLLAAVFGLGIFLPVASFKPWSERRLCSLPLEVLAVIAILLLSCYGLCMELVTFVASGKANIEMGNILMNTLIYKKSILNLLVLTGNVIIFTLYFLGAWFLGISLRPIRELGLLEYLRKRCYLWQNGHRIKMNIKSVYHYFLHVDLTKNSLKAIRRIVLINALVLAVISMTWLGGLAIVVVYSIILYLFLKKYISDLQKRYGILLKAVDEMAEGNLDVTIEEDLGVFEPFKPQVIKIQNGFRKAVSDEVKSQHMKAELITNVSHDLKTPLTAIITYVNLLKDPNLTEEQCQEYLDTLERKSMRLKVLIEDLFEVSKANSKNVTLNLMPVDIMNLVKQVSFEMRDKLDESMLDIRMNLTEEKITISLDSQKTYRIYENLFSNVAKYALPGTRVYVNGFRINDTVVITIKNISAQELTVEPADLTERFVRGDESRNTDGSGLGLAIAKSFSELQGGALEVDVDGDLFKVTTVWHV